MLNWIIDDKLKQAPSNQRLALQADYIELLAIVSIDKSYRISSYVDQISEDEAFSFNDGIQNEQKPSDWGDEQIIDESIRLPTENSGDLDIVFGQRKLIWAEKWPFEWSAQDQELKFNTSNPNVNIYVSLLLASSFRMIKRTDYKFFSTFLEQAGYHVLGEIFPKWTVKGFGANQSVGEHYAQSTPLDKFTALANDLNCPLNETYEPSSTGDGQVDLVAYYSWQDLRGQFPTVFAQCCCSPSQQEIGDKIAEADYTNILNKLRLHSHNLNFYFSPQDLGDLNRKTKWSIERINGATIVDRGRLLKTLTNGSFVNSISSMANDFTALSVNFDVG